LVPAIRAASSAASFSSAALRNSLSFTSSATRSSAVCEERIVTLTSC
jgi:hypothetical protein